MEKIKEKVLKSINDNRLWLPINAASWEIFVIDSKINTTVNDIALGKYCSLDCYTENFYKPVSRTILLVNEKK